MPVDFQEILGAFEFVGMSGALGEHQAVLCRRTGKIYWRSEYSGLDELNDELPDDVEDDENYVAIPDKRELGLGKPLALGFAREFLPNDFDEELLRPLLHHARPADDVARNGGCQYAPRNAAIPTAHAVVTQIVSILTPAREGSAGADLLDPPTALGWQPAARATCGTPSSPPPDAQRSVAGRVGPAYP